jgi:hypothetical protein
MRREVIREEGADMMPAYCGGGNFDILAGRFIIMKIRERGENPDEF